MIQPMDIYKFYGWLIRKAHTLCKHMVVSHELELRCAWCNSDPNEAAKRFGEGPHATWCVHYRIKWKS